MADDHDVTTDPYNQAFWEKKGAKGWGKKGKGKYSNPWNKGKGDQPFYDNKGKGGKDDKGKGKGKTFAATEEKEEQPATQPDADLSAPHYADWSEGTWDQSWDWKIWHSSHEQTSNTHMAMMASPDYHQPVDFSAIDQKLTQTGTTSELNLSVDRKSVV